MKEYPHSEHELLARLFDGSLTEADRRALDERMQGDADLAATVQTVQRLAEIIPPVDTDDVREAVTDVDTRAAWKRVEARIGDMASATSLAADRPASAPSQATRGPAATIYQFRYMAVAASVVLLSVFLSLLLRPDRAPAWESVSVARGEVRAVELGDGSRVVLNADSHLEHAVSSGAAVRQVRLRGEARFEVASDGRAFVVETHEVRVRVLGTTFSVRARGDVTSVAVQEGRVAVETESEATELAPDEAVEVRAGGAVRVLAEDAARAADDWTRGVLTFQRVALVRALADVERTFDVEVALVGSWTGDETVSGSFPGQDVDEVLGSLCRIYACDVREHSAGAGRGFDLVR